MHDEVCIYRTIMHDTGEPSMNACTHTHLGVDYPAYHGHLRINKNIRVFILISPSIDSAERYPGSARRVLQKTEPPRAEWEYKRVSHSSCLPRTTFH